MLPEDATDPCDEAAEPESCGFMSVLAHDHESAGDEVELEDLVARIETRGTPAREIEGEDMGPVVEIRFHGEGTGRCIQLMLDATAALELCDRIAEQARQAMGS